MKHLAIALTLLLVAGAAVDAETGRATIFGRTGDRHLGGNAKCLGRKVQPSDWGIAHRRLPCGTMVRVTNLRTGAQVVAPVIDAGPWGAMHDGAWLIKRRAADPGVWRGIADVTPAVAARLGHRSFDRVRIEVVR